METKVNEIADIESKIQALEQLIGRHDDKDQTKDTGIYKVIHENFTDLMGS